MPLLWWYTSGMRTEVKETKITIRIPAVIAERMRRLANENDRSLNGEILRALREYTQKHKSEK